MARNRNQLVVPQARQAMEQFKNEVAAELGLANYNSLDKGWLASRQNGYVGGNMTKKMVQIAEQAIASQGPSIAAGTKLEVPQEIFQMNQLASTNQNAFVQQLSAYQGQAH